MRRRVAAIVVHDGMNFYYSIKISENTQQIKNIKKW